ncbi:Dolichyl-phosphate-mannose-protein mannosyltransferase [Bryocella elongata]|uniref:Dolichyl-phosphate-mannose-protein mannosyltransferase n=1 Tax=Bryocella elongata TaxID=863522 RepID=A0A1H6BZE9_9BACT|nr:glycosyltransferase family 39 protein [Bryocella elongata]SEG66013.1 Dolichyl-phosphate-mannose-protein mannosyltransferase [Bryocella elongata]
MTLPQRRWRWPSLALLTCVWGVLQLGGLFSPGLLDDVDSVYTQIAREMLGRHDYVTPYIDGIRFFDKPPLMYWMAAGSMKIFGQHDWAARLPLALGVLLLLFAVYALGIRFFAGLSPQDAPDRGGLYAALAVATSIGPYLYTRFYIPDILLALWMTLAIHLFLIALDRLREARSAIVPMLGFGAVMGIDVLTKGLIGLVFPVGFVLLYLAFTRRLKLLARLSVVPATLAFLVVAAPWHILAALRNPPVAMPAGLGLPARAGWAWFYLYNEHVARFLGKRIPHDYGQVPIPLFWLLLFLWLIPWAAFLPAALRNAWRTLRAPQDTAVRFDSDLHASHENSLQERLTAVRHEAALTCMLWAGIVLGFFTVSSRQEYYHLPAIPALALLAGGLLAAADRKRTHDPGAPRLDSETLDRTAPYAQALRGALYMLVPLGTILFLICGILAIISPAPKPGLTLNDALSSNPELYNLSLGHVFDLTGSAMGFFRGPLLAVSLGMLALGPIAYLVRRKGFPFAANLAVAGAMTIVLMAAHEGLARFYPILGSKDLAEAILSDDPAQKTPVLIDGELTSGSSLLFYLNNPVLLVNGRINGPWFGSFWPDARPIFLTDDDLMQWWHNRTRVYVLTYHPDQRVPQLCQQGPVYKVADSGGKTILRNSAPGQATKASQPNLCSH